MKISRCILSISVFCVAFSLTLPAQTFNSLYNFAGIDGQFPQGPLVQGFDGNLYGTTLSGGATGDGSIFKITPSGQLTTIYSFCSRSHCVDGYLPYAGLVLATNGNFYGTTYQGGQSVVTKTCPIYGCGTVFEVSPTGAFKSLYSFCAASDCSDGLNPRIRLIQGIDGNFYGATSRGGSNSGGTVFEITPDGKLTTLYGFCTPQTCNPYDGPVGAISLVQTPSGALFASGGGGPSNAGTIYELTPANKLISGYAFSHPESGPNALILGADGDFYGSAQGGYVGNLCAAECGEVFRFAQGKFSVLAKFSCLSSSCPDGANPWGTLAQGNDGNFYGTAGDGGNNSNSVVCFNGGCGTIFEVTASGQLSGLYSFCSQSNCTDGAEPQSGLMQATNGTFYGTTYLGGITQSGACENAGCGTVFSLSVGLSAFVQALPNFGGPGKVINILGNGLTGSTSVRFNGTAATFTVISDTQIQATVPTGATSGTIQVTTPTGTLSSNISFRALS